MKYICIKNLTKSIKGNTILDNINYKFESGNIYGIYGHNGSGKTMLFRAISGLIRPTSGSINISGKELHKDNDIISLNAKPLTNGDSSCPNISIYVTQWL